MEAVLSYVKVLVILIGETEHISLRRHCLVESCIEYNNLRNICGNNALAGTESECMSVVVNGSKLTEFINLVNDFICNKNGLIKNISPLYDTVTNS